VLLAILLNKLFFLGHSLPLISAEMFYDLDQAAQDRYLCNLADYIAIRPLNEHTIQQVKYALCFVIEHSVDPMILSAVFRVLTLTLSLVKS